MVADLHNLVGDTEKAKSLAAEVLLIAEAMEYDDLSARARQLVDGKDDFQKYSAIVASWGPGTEDTMLAAESDDRIRVMAKTLLASFQAPPDRVGMAERECFLMRQIAGERVNWCRHLDLVPLMDPATAFSEAIERVCGCRKLGHESPQPSRGADALIADFKREVCAACQDRQPWRAGG